MERKQKKRRGARGRWEIAIEMQVGARKNWGSKKAWQRESRE